MRWNCPHCKKLVTAGINFETTTKAYVRCKNCNGLSLVHRSAMIAKYLEARRLEEEALAEKRTLARTVASTKAVSMNAVTSEVHAPSRLSTLSAPTGLTQTAATPSTPRIATNTPPPFQASSGGMAVHTQTSPNFRAHAFEDATGFDPIVESSGDGATAAALPVFNYASPPAFLLKEKRIEPTAFTEGPAPTHTAPSNPASEMNAIGTKLKMFLNSNFAVWVAAGLALASGFYLFVEGRRSLESVSSSRALEETSTTSKQ